MMKLLYMAITLVSLLGSAGACNRFYTSVEGGRFLARINRRNGNTKLVGKWAAGAARVDRVIDSMEWDFSQQTMFGLEQDASRPSRSQRFVKINRRLARSINVNRETFGLTGRFDLKGLAVDGNGTVYTHSLETQTLFTVNPDTGELSELFVTGLANVLDLAFKIDTHEIWAVTGTQMYIIDPRTQRVTEFKQTFIRKNPDSRLVAIAFNPVRHVPVALTQGVPNASTVIPTSIYAFSVAKGRERFRGSTDLTDVRGGTIQCKQKSAAPSDSPTAIPTAKPPFKSQAPHSEHGDTIFLGKPPTPLPTKSPIPSFAPSVDPEKLLELNPFQLTVEYSSSEVLNVTALDYTLEKYYLAEQRSPRVADVRLTRRCPWCKRPPKLNPRVVDKRRLLDKDSDSVQTEVFEYEARALLSDGNISENLKARIAAQFVSAVENSRKLEKAVNENDAVLVGSPPNETVKTTATFVSASPSMEPSTMPSPMPTTTTAPSAKPSTTPTVVPTVTPTAAPSVAPTVAPTSSPTLNPLPAPTLRPWRPPPQSATGTPAAEPPPPLTSAPARPPANVPSKPPSKKPSSNEPSLTPSAEFSALPSNIPSLIPSGLPSETPTITPSDGSSGSPSGAPSFKPSSASTQPSAPPAVTPSGLPSSVPNAIPSSIPSSIPSDPPSDPGGSEAPSSNPSVDTGSSAPSDAPSSVPTSIPTQTSSPTLSKRPSTAPTESPTISKKPSNAPSSIPTQTFSPTLSSRPSRAPTGSPRPTVSKAPSTAPSTPKSEAPSMLPSEAPVGGPSKLPSSDPVAGGSDAPSVLPSDAAIIPPSSIPSEIPTIVPTRQPSANVAPS